MYALLSLSLSHASSRCHSSFTLLELLISSSRLPESSMTSGLSKASYNYVVRCLTPSIDSYGPPNDKYHIKQFTLARQAINNTSSVSIPSFVLIGWNMAALIFGAHQSRNTITNKNLESLICVKMFLNIILSHANCYGPRVGWCKLKPVTTSAAKKNCHVHPLLCNLSFFFFFTFSFFIKYETISLQESKNETI